MNKEQRVAQVLSGTVSSKGTREFVDSHTLCQVVDWECPVCEFVNSTILSCVRRDGEEEIYDMENVRCVACRKTFSISPDVWENCGKKS